jgi:uroporphyrinogen-III synthase
MLETNPKTCFAHCSRRTLYLGLELPDTLKAKDAVHFPIIQIVPYPLDAPKIKEAFSHIQNYTHIIFTSKTAVRLFFQALKFYKFNLEQLHLKTFITVGKSTSQALQQHGIKADIVARNETAEGIIEELTQIDCSDAYFFWPHSAHSRPVITNFFKQNRIKHQECLLYETQPINPSGKLPDLSRFDEIMFTSPSTLDAFIAIFGQLPTDIRLTTIGPVTQAHLKTLKQ